ncbi:hypothetical protein BDV35DRAFT_374145 [Aspergillus flavus]|uniref:Uncharacterized protein n=1 Tax=Aspergillus flavus TaxID=5059 RepID=A0A5N6GCZ0_ASPFL|nr:hypothetical protein BDV35DRAFT_374145 [Aspergillus flavus]
MNIVLASQVTSYGFGYLSVCVVYSSLWFKISNLTFSWNVFHSLLKGIVTFFCCFCCAHPNQSTLYDESLYSHCVIHALHGYELYTKILI